MHRCASVARAGGGEPATNNNPTRCLTHRGAFTAPARPSPRRENLSLSVPDLLKTVKQFVQPDKHGQLDQMLNRYLSKELGKQQARMAPPIPPACRLISTVLLLPKILIMAVISSATTLDVPGAPSALCSLCATRMAPVNHR